MINRAEKRRILRQTQSTITDRVRVHECGHVFGRILTAPVLGYELNECVTAVNIGAYDVYKRDGKVWISQGATLGPILSKQMNVFFNERHSPDSDLTLASFNEFRAAGFNVREWFLTQIIIILAGPECERRFLNGATDSEWENGKQNDMVDIVRCARNSGEPFEHDQALRENLIRQATITIQSELDKPGVWNGVLRLTRAMHGVKSMKGDKAVAIMCSNTSRRAA